VSETARKCRDSSAPCRFYNDLTDREDCQSTRKSYKTSHFVGWNFQIRGPLPLRQQPSGFEEFSSSIPRLDDAGVLSDEGLFYGMRLDHFLLSPKVSDRLVDGGVDRCARAQVSASDHAPTWIMLDL